MVKEVRARGNPCKGLLSTRYLLAILGSIGLGIIYGLKVNLHVAIVSMVNHTAVTGEDHGKAKPPSPCQEILPINVTQNSTIAVSEDGPFAWDSTVQGLLLSSYFWGYIVAQLPGGRIAELFSAKWVMFFSVAINVICTILSPVMAQLHYGALIVMRVGEGIGGGVTFPSMHVMLAHWAPPSERSVMSSIVYAGTALGTVIFMFFSGLIAATIGWEAIFYIEGGLSVLWLLIWAVLIADTPQEQRFITQEERNFITESLNQGKVEVKHEEKHKVPWKSVLTSPAFLAILIAHTCSNWGWYMVLIELPLYMKNVLNFQMSQNAVLGAMPFLFMWLFSMVLSQVLDRLRGRKIINTTIARKIATGFASVVPMICFIILCFVQCAKTLAVVLMTIAVMCIGGMFCGFLSNHIDIAANFAGTLMAMTNTIATIPGILVPLFVGQITSALPDDQAWRIVFGVTIVLYVIEIVIYNLFGSGEEQTWNKVQEDPGESQPLKSPVQESNITSKDIGSA